MIAPFLQKPYVFAFALALLTATVVWLYSSKIEKNATHVNRSFFKTLAAGLLVGGALAYLASPRAEPLNAEPFDAAGAGAAGI